MKLANLLPPSASAELLTVQNQVTEVRYAGNEFERIDRTDITTQTLRVQQEGRIVTIASSRPGSEEDMVQKALSSIRFGAPYTVPFASDAAITAMHLVNDAEWSAEELISCVDNFVQELRTIDNRLMVGASLRASKQRVHLTTSNGFDYSYEKTVWSSYGAIELVQGDDLLYLYKFSVALGPDIDFSAIKNELKQVLAHSEHVVPFTAGAYPVLFVPNEVGHIITPFTSSLNGLSMYREISPWNNLLDTQQLDPRFTLIDDGSADGEVASQPFDTEGTPTQRNVLIDKGCPHTMLLDRRVGQLLNLPSTGNAGAGTPAPHRLCITPGSQGVDHLIKSMDYGMIVYGSMGAWSGNPFTGVVSGSISHGLKVERGEIVGRVKDSMFTVNSFQHFRDHLIDMSHQAYDVAGNSFPYILLDQVVISAK